MRNKRTTHTSATGVMGERVMPAHDPGRRVSPGSAICEPRPRDDQPHVLVNSRVTQAQRLQNAIRRFDVDEKKVASNSGTGRFRDSESIDDAIMAAPKMCAYSVTRTPIWGWNHVSAKLACCLPRHLHFILPTQEIAVVLLMFLHTRISSPPSKARTAGSARCTNLYNSIRLTSNPKDSRRL